MIFFQKNKPFTLVFLIIIFFQCENKKPKKKLFYTDDSRGILSIYANEKNLYWADDKTNYYDIKTATFGNCYLSPFSEKEYKMLCDSILKNKPPNFIEGTEIGCFGGFSHIIIQEGVKSDTFYFPTFGDHIIRDYIKKIIKEKEGNAKKQNKYFGFEYMKKYFQIDSLIVQPEIL